MHVVFRFLLAFFIISPTFVWSQLNVNYLVVGGGGGGGAGSDRTSGGGSGGQVITGSATISPGPFSITVGAGGGSNGNGANSTFNGITSVGGGRGGSRSGSTLTAANNSAYAGGSHHFNSTAGVNGSVLRRGGAGFDGGASGPWAAGGGGGAGGNGSNGASTGGGNGGVGQANALRTGANQTYSTGGKGGFQNSSGYFPGAGSNAAANTGNGGAGGASSGTITGRSGGSGIVVIRYASNTKICSGGTETSYTLSGVTYQVHTFLSSGTLVYNPVITAHPSTGTQNICINGSATTLSVTATGSSITYQWYSNTTASNTGGTIISGATSASYTPPTHTAGTRYYYCYVTNATGNQTSNVSGAIIISNPSVSGSISGANSVTAGTNSTVLTLNGYTGSIQWQSSSDNVTFSNIAGAASPTYTATNLSATTHYRAAVTSGGCAVSHSSSVSILVVPAPNAASTLSITGTGTTLNVTNNAATEIDPNLVVTSDGHISGFAISITDNYFNGDELDYTGNLPSGVSAASFNTVSRSLVFSGSAPASEWQALLRTVRLKTTSVTCNPESRKVSFSASTNFFNYFNGHYYEYVPTITSWTNAKAYAESRTFFGRQGYLVTINSPAENAFIYKLINLNTWIGASDNFSQINGAVGFTKYANQNSAEGKWHWITGPEKGVQMRTGNASTAIKPGNPINGVYQNWNLCGSYNCNEPNDFKSTSIVGQEDYGHLFANSGRWNDFPNNGRASIIEYGGMPGDSPVNTLEFTRDIFVIGATSGSISGGNITVCPGVNSTPLTLNGATGTVARWEYSNDNFLDDVRPIVNTSSTLTALNVDSTFYYRAIMVNGTCTLATNAQPIFVHQTFPGAVLAISNQICEGSNAELALYGYSGTITKWQITSDTLSSITDINTSADILSHTITSSGNFWFRCFVEQASCSTQEATEWYPISVSAGSPPVGGTVNSAFHCGVNNSGVFRLTGASGNSYQWQYSSDGGANWIVTGASAPNLPYHNITQNRLYRVLVSKGACGSTYSDTAKFELYGINTSQWIGGSNKNWNNPSNWCSGIPADNGRMVDISTAAVNDIALDNNRRLATLNFNGSSRKILLGDYELSVDSIIGGDSLNYIRTNGNGRLKQSIGQGERRVFPVGNSSYNPVVIENNNAGDDVFSVLVVDSVRMNGLTGDAILTPHVNRIWDINKLNPSNASGVDFTFSWSDTEETAPMSGYYLNHYEAGVGWEVPTITGVASLDSADGERTLHLPGYTGFFSPFAVGDDPVIPLPVSLLYFRIQCDTYTPMFEWATAAEINNSHFTLSTANEDQEWTVIAEVPGAIYSNSERQYQLPLPQLRYNKTQYFKLSQQDLNGDSKSVGFLSFISCDAFPGEESQLPKVFPNPVFDESFVTGLDPNSIFTITNISGSQIVQGQVAENGTLILELPFPCGMYFLQGFYLGKPYSMKIIKY